VRSVGRKFFPVAATRRNGISIDNVCAKRGCCWAKKWSLKAIKRTKKRRECPRSNDGQGVVRVDCQRRLHVWRRKLCLCERRKSSRKERNVRTLL